MPVDFSHIASVYGGTILLCASFVLFAGVIILLAGRLLRIQSWEAYLNTEMAELVSSCFIILFALGFFVAADQAAYMFLPQNIGSLGLTAPSAGNIANLNDLTPPAAVAYRISIMRNTELTTGISDMFTLQVCLSIMSTFQRRLGEAVLTNTYKIFPGVDSMVQVTSILGYGMVAIANSLDAQVTIFLLVDSIVLPFLLPAGVLFRFIPPTRTAGNFLIALSISLQAVLPITYLLNFSIIDSMHIAPYTTPVWLPSLCGGKYAFFGFLGNKDAPVLSLIPGFIPFANIVKATFTEYTINLLSPLEFTAFMDMFARLSLPALFMPALATTISVAFVNSFKKFLELKVD